jgi:hypothetical protein
MASVSREEKSVFFTPYWLVDYERLLLSEKKTPNKQKKNRPVYYMENLKSLYERISLTRFYLKIRIRVANPDEHP